MAEPPVAVVTKNAEANRTTEIANAYLAYLVSPEGQPLAAQHYYRPRGSKFLTDEQRALFGQVTLVGKTLLDRKLKRESYSSFESTR